MWTSMYIFLSDEWRRLKIGSYDEWDVEFSDIPSTSEEVEEWKESGG